METVFYMLYRAVSLNIILTIKKTIMKRHLLLILMVAFWVNTNAQNIKIDSTFGKNGMIIESKGYNYIAPQKVIEFNDDSYLIYSTFHDKGEKGGELRKYKKSGELDEIFADGGIYTLEFESDSVFPNFVILEDNKIAVTDFLKDTCNVHILDKDGTLVSKFELKFYLKDIIPSQLEYLNGFLYVSGLFSDGGIGKTSFIIKTDLEGNIDSSFADNGIFKYGGEYARNGNYFILQGNKLLLLHSYYNTEYFYERFTQNIIRLNADGEIDKSFGDDGVVFLDDYLFTSVNNIALDSKLNIYISSTLLPVVIKLDKDGSKDKDYGDDGIAFYFISEHNPIENHFGITIHEEQVYLFGGTYKNDGVEEKLIGSILNYGEDGEPNKSFGNDGVCTLDIDIPYVTFFTGVFDKDEDILAIGNYGVTNGWLTDSRDYILTRFTQKPSSIYETENSVVNIYPNPANSVINIDVTGQLNYNISLFNMLGKLVYSAKNQRSININSIPKGTYMLELKDTKTNKKIIEKIVVER